MMSGFIPPEDEVLYYNFRYAHEHYDKRVYVPNTVAGVRAQQIISGTATYVGLADGDGNVSYVEVA